jgi:hypothetical protein
LHLLLLLQLHLLLLLLLEPLLLYLLLLYLLRLPSLAVRIRHIISSPGTIWNVHLSEIQPFDSRFHRRGTTEALEGLPTACRRTVTDGRRAF